MSNPIQRESGDGLTARHKSTPLPLVRSVPDRPPDTRPAIAVQGTSKESALEYVSGIKQRIVDLAIRWFEPAARIAVFVIYFWFGFLKLISLSPATPLASALTSHTIGMQYFNISFKALALYECGLGLLFLIPALTWLSVVLLVIHMAIVSSPLVIVANVAWVHPLVPTLEGQYIIKDLAIIALAIGILAHRHLQRLAPQSGLPPSALPVDLARPAPPDTSGRASDGFPSGRTTSMSRWACWYVRPTPSFSSTSPVVMPGHGLRMLPNARVRAYSKSRHFITTGVLVQGFKKFLLRGNLIDLAVAVVIGAAFGAAVTALVKDLLTPLISAIGGQKDFSKLSFTVHHSTFLYGDFFNALISFVIIATIVYFLVVAPVTRLIAFTQRKQEATDRPCPECLSDIPIQATRCKFCTATVPPVGGVPMA